MVMTACATDRQAECTSRHDINAVVNNIVSDTEKTATNGQEAIDLLERADDVSIVLMDIMMPAMDGYETIRRIRQQPRFRFLPIIALTAKAMKGDRDKCLEAGASDYIAKPVDTDQLLSLMRIWLHR